MTHPVFEIVTTTAGAVSIRNKIVNEIMHNPVGPWPEANALYIRPSRLADRLRENVSKELVIFDVGLGAAANALATLHSLRQAATSRPVRLVSFERDLELLRFALDHASQFEHFRGFENAIETLLAEGRWRNGTVDWQLRHGDFPELITTETSRADLIFFDPYSPAVNGDMWTVNTFKKLRLACADSGSLLLTYSRSTPIRAALLHAGFFVGAGPATGLKPETTQASTRLEDLENPFGSAWLERWKRSHVPHPLEAQESEFEALRASLLNHPQFAKD